METKLSERELDCMKNCSVAIEKLKHEILKDKTPENEEEAHRAVGRVVSWLQNFYL